MLQQTVTCTLHNSDTSINPWDQAIKTHRWDFTVYLIDVIPLNALASVGSTRSYIGSAGANATRTKETKTSDKLQPYIKGSMDARYRGGSYTLNHTRSQDVCILVVGDTNVPAVGEDLKAFYKRANQPGFKNAERALLGYIEYRIHRVAVSLGVDVNNREDPKHANFPEYDVMDDSTFFNTINFIGDVPNIVRIAQGKKTIGDVVEEQRTFAIKFAQNLLDRLK